MPSRRTFLATTASLTGVCSMAGCARVFGSRNGSGLEQTDRDGVWHYYEISLGEAWDATMVQQPDPRPVVIEGDVSAPVLIAAMNGEQFENFSNRESYISTQHVLEPNSGRRLVHSVEEPGDVYVVVDNTGYWRSHDRTGPVSGELTVTVN